MTRCTEILDIAVAATHLIQSGYFAEDEAINIICKNHDLDDAETLTIKYAIKILRLQSNT